MIVVDHTCPCIACGYDLKGLAREDRCPECGRHVRASHHGPTLDRADAHWAHAVRSGQRQIAWASTLLTVGALLFAVAYLVFFFQVFDDPRAVIRLGVFTIGPFVALGFTLLISGGVRVTAREPTTYPEMPERRACRGFLWAILTLGALLAPTPLLLALGGSVSRTIAWCADILLLALVGAGLMLAWYAARYLARLAVRAPDGKLPASVRSATISLVGAAALLALGVVPSNLLSDALRWQNEPDRYYILGLTLLVALTIGAGVRFSTVMHRLSRAVRRGSVR